MGSLVGPPVSLRWREGREPGAGLNSTRPPTAATTSSGCGGGCDGETEKVGVVCCLEFLSFPLDVRFSPPRGRWLRERGSRFAMAYMRAEDEQTNSVCIGPVNKAFHVLT